MKHQNKIWLLRLILPFAYGRWCTGILMLLLFSLIFHFGEDDSADTTSPLLFFSIILAYIIPVFSYIVEQSSRALVELRPHLNLDEDQFYNVKLALTSRSGIRSGAIALAGVMGGLGHLAFMGNPPARVVTAMMSGGAVMVNILGTLLVWVVMSTVIVQLVRSARQYARLGADSVRIELLNTRVLVPFARVAIISSLALLGALALYPLMFFDQSISLYGSMPGLVATTIPMLIIFAMPIWPVHKRIAEAKEQELAVINRRIQVEMGNKAGDQIAVETLERVAPLLNYRREIMRVSPWPFDASAITRLGLYIVIVPLTWAGAALIEILIELYI
ncbi:MAG: hypothetical protein HOC23_18005 [Halieaceae bacterium]|jgi:hypothetical protein|nr:hypothetical protein [Halieaceae bacterium]